MNQVGSSVVGLADSGIGPVTVTVTQFQNFDIDDFVHSVTLSQCIALQLQNAIAQANPVLAQKRPPLSINGYVIGGF